MKEVFIKSFWEGVKKTFDEALEGPPPANTGLQTQAEGDLRAPLTEEKPPAPSGRATWANPATRNPFRTK